MSQQLSTILSFLIRVFPFLLDLTVVTASITLTYLLYYQKIPEGNKDFVTLALGLLLGKMSTIIDFHRGTSSERLPKREGDFK